MNRNVPLASRTPLRRVAAPGNPWSTFAPRTVPLRTPQAKPKAAATGRGGTGQRKASPPGRFSDNTRHLIRTRAGEGDPHDAMCEYHENCWLGINGGEMQHVVARGMGGSRNPVINSPAGGILLCREAHALAEARDARMGKLGFWLPQGTDPLLVPMLLHGASGGGRLVWRSADGGYLNQAPEVAA